MFSYHTLQLVELDRHTDPSELTAVRHAQEKKKNNNKVRRTGEKFQSIFSEIFFLARLKIRSERSLCKEREREGDDVV
jgi:hypothetical protein